LIVLLHIVLIAGPAQGSAKKPELDEEPEAPERKLIFVDLDLYITLCKGNVYQSCGDDEQSLLHYLEGLTAAQHVRDKDWEIICLNSIGMLAYYNLRYDVAALCFHAVVAYRSEVSASQPSLHSFLSFLTPTPLLICCSKGVWRGQRGHRHCLQQRGLLPVLPGQARRGARAL
jgi:hypothetical protein